MTRTPAGPAPTPPFPRSPELRPGPAATYGAVAGDRPPPGRAPAGTQTRGALA
ncbi:hypothetical protein [Streptomyces sp. H34-S4]|uniref:hypothetical protein n=1 Tax=Streptomyces sp. H34-S4 TaxID=2996463 RepID=UPI00226DC628|nr:hypothetical protein [Streptomyces sp. H34-S4]MCY0935764.1 hypothetical protein [Streptomyces sp. H34-S4]